MMLYNLNIFSLITNWPFVGKLLLLCSTVNIDLLNIKSSYHRSVMQWHQGLYHPGNASDELSRLPIIACNRRCLKD